MNPLRPQQLSYAATDRPIVDVFVVSVSLSRDGSDPDEVLSQGVLDFYLSGW